MLPPARQNSQCTISHSRTQASDPRIRRFFAGPLMTLPGFPAGLPAGRSRADLFSRPPVCVLGLTKNRRFSRRTGWTFHYNDGILHQNGNFEEKLVARKPLISLNLRVILSAACTDLCSKFRTRRELTSASTYRYSGQGRKTTKKKNSFVRRSALISC